MTLLNNGSHFKQLPWNTQITTLWELTTTDPLGNALGHFQCSLTVPADPREQLSLQPIQRNVTSAHAHPHDF